MTATLLTLNSSKKLYFSSLDSNNNWLK